MKMVVLNSSVGPKVHVLEFKLFFMVAGFEWNSPVSENGISPWLQGTEK